MTPRITTTLSLLAATAALATASPVRADPFTYTALATYSVGGGPATPVLSSSTSAPVSISPSAGSGNTIFGHDYGAFPSSSGLQAAGFGTRSSGTGTYTINGSFEDATSFTNTTGAAGDFVLTYLVSAGDVNVNLPSGANGTQSASISEQVSVNGAIRFSTAASMLVTGSANTPTFTQSGAVLNPAGPTLSPGSGDYTFGNYFGTIDLGVLQPNQSVSLDALATSSATGTTTISGSCGTVNPSAVRALVVIGPGGGCGSAVGRIGDPPTIAGQPFGPFVSITPAASPVPEPASAALLGAGLLALAGWRRHRA